MYRSTTRDEYKAFMRKWRAVLANCRPPERSWMLDPSVQVEARSIAFGAVYKEIPAIFWDFRPEAHKTYRDFKVESLPRICIKMNSEGKCPNSYPHETRNP